MRSIRSTTLTLAGIAWLAVSLHPRTMRDKRRGLLGEWMTARALKSKLKRKKLARGRIFGHGSDSVEVDLLVATPNAIHVVETKYRQCQRITGTATDRHWWAVNAQGKLYQTNNAFRQASRQKRAIEKALRRAHIKVPVHAWVAIHGTDTVPEHPHVHTDGGELASAIEKADWRENGAEPGLDAFDTLMDLSSTVDGTGRTRRIEGLNRASAALNPTNEFGESQCPLP